MPSRLLIISEFPHYAAILRELISFVPLSLERKELHLNLRPLGNRVCCRYGTWGLWLYRLVLVFYEYRRYVIR